MKPRIFISAVSAEFATLRDQHVDPLLRKLGCEPDAMKVFPTLSGDLRQALQERIDACEGLIQLVGAGYGREPPSVDSEYGRVSYTQFELYYARLKGKKLWVFTAAEGTGVQRDQLIEQLDLPPETENLADPLAYQAERRGLQGSYWLFATFGSLMMLKRHVCSKWLLPTRRARAPMPDPSALAWLTPQFVLARREFPSARAPLLARTGEATGRGTARGFDGYLRPRRPPQASCQRPDARCSRGRAGTAGDAAMRTH